MGKWPDVYPRSVSLVGDIINTAVLKFYASLPAGSTSIKDDSFFVSAYIIIVCMHIGY